MKTLVRVDLLPLEAETGAANPRGRRGLFADADAPAGAVLLREEPLAFSAVVDRRHLQRTAVLCGTAAADVPELWPESVATPREALQVLAVEVANRGLDHADWHRATVPLDLDDGASRRCFMALVVDTGPWAGLAAAEPPPALLAADRDLLRAVSGVVVEVATPIGSWRMGYALYARLAYINHSCAPNAALVFGLRGRATLVALAPIAAGEEICVTLLADNESLELAARRKLLADLYGFMCRCDACCRGWAPPAVLDWNAVGIGGGAIRTAMLSFFSRRHDARAKFAVLRTLRHAQGVYRFVGASTETHPAVRLLRALVAEALVSALPSWDEFRPEVVAFCVDALRPLAGGSLDAGPALRGRARVQLAMIEGLAAHLAGTPISVDGLARVALADATVDALLLPMLAPVVRRAAETASPRM